MGEDMKQCFDRDRCDRFDKDRCEPIREECECRDHDDGWNWGDWLPILIIVFLLCGGTNIFGGGGYGCSRSDCYDNNGIFGSGWLLILLLVFLFLGNGNQRGCGNNGFLGGLFG